MTASPSTALPNESRPLQRLRGLIGRDTNVVIASVIVTNLLRAISTVILTRLLVPEIFGMSGIIGAISFAAAMASDLGFQAFVVRHQDGDKPEFLDTVWTIAVIRAAVLTTTLAVLATPIANILAKPELAPLIALSSLSFVIEGLASLTLLTAIRNRQLIRLSLSELSVLAVQIVVGIVLAYLWRDIWALLVALLISSVLKTALSYIIFSGARRRFAFDRGYARDLWHFARYVTGSSIITLILLQSDKLVLARLMPLEDFGLYILAGNLVAAPLAFTTAYASRVLYPAYAQLWRDGVDDLCRQFYAKRWGPSLLYSFAAGGLIGSAPLVISILYDPRYAGAGLYLQLLALNPFFALASNSANEALTATGRIEATLQASISKLVWLAIAAPIGFVFGGEIGLVAAVGLMEVPALLVKWIQMHRAGLLRLGYEMLFLSAGAAGTLIGAVANWLLIGSLG